MLPWQPSRDVHEIRARSRALWGAGIGYVLMVLFLTFTFRSQKPLLSVTFRGGAPACVLFHKEAKGSGKRQGKGLSQHALYAAALIRKRAALMQTRKLRALEQKKAAAERASLRKKKRDELARQKAQKAAEEAAKERERCDVLKRKKQAEKKDVAAHQGKQAAKEHKEVVIAEKPLKKILAKKEQEPLVEEPAVVPSQEQVEKNTPEPIPDPDQAAPYGEQLPQEEAGEDALEEIVLGEKLIEDDSEASRDIVALMGAISRAWKPPRGLNKIPQARLIVSVLKDGTVENVEIESKSGVVAYDMAARAALWRTVYPAVFWGKRIAVLFGQQ